MSEPQHPTPFGSQTGSHSGNQPERRGFGRRDGFER